MKNSHHLYLVCAISISLAGCGTSGLKEVSKLQTAPLMTDCMQKATSYIYNNEQHEFSSASISIAMPVADDSTYIAKTIKSFLSRETESLNEYDKVLKQNPIVKILHVDLTSTNSKVSCDYVYFTDKNSAITQAPILFKVMGDGQKHFINAEESVTKITPIEYLFDLPKNQHGFRLFDLEYTATQTKPTINNQDILKRIQEVISSNSLLEFYDLDQPVQESLAENLANQATSHLNIPSFVPQNPIYIVPPIEPKRIMGLDVEETNNINTKQMQQYNDNRYVDASTGINTSRNVLQQMRQEFGFGDSRFNVGGDSSSSADLSINTNNYTQDQIREGDRQMQQEREKEKSWSNR